MQTTNKLNSPNKEGQILLALQHLKTDQSQSLRKAAGAFEVSRKTLGRRRDGIPSRRDSVANSRSLTLLEEEVIIQHILDLDSRGFSPTPRVVADMANDLRTRRGMAHVGKNWTTNFVKRTPELKTRFSRKYDYKRALYKDPRAIKAWFKLVRNTKAKYGIIDDDIFNFDETGFQMGVTSTIKVVTAAERRQNPKQVQPGNREWATVIECVNASGWAVPPFIILKGRAHLENWYTEPLPDHWVTAVSENGWTTNELGFQWLQHFERHTASRKSGGWRLLVLDGHESHLTAQFTTFCAGKNIITLCMPPHSSHLLQPLDVACFAPLKKAYGREIGELMASHIHHVTKVEFLASFVKAHNAALSKENIQAGFRGAGIVPLDPQSVIEKLNVRLRTPSPSLSQNGSWQPRTPHTAIELAAQTDFLKTRIARHQDSSPSSINEALNQLSKGAEMMIHSAALLGRQVTALQRANTAATQRKARKRRRIQTGGVIVSQNSEYQDVQSNNEPDRASLRQNSPEVVIATRSKRRCGYCRETGHRIETCMIRKRESA
jgi:hypothetical protein